MLGRRGGGWAHMAFAFLMMLTAADAASAQLTEGRAEIRLQRDHVHLEPGGSARIPLVLVVTCPAQARLGNANFQAVWWTGPSPFQPEIRPRHTNFTFAPQECVEGSGVTRAIHANLTLIASVDDQAVSIMSLPNAFQNITSMVHASFFTPGQEWRAEPAAYQASVGFALKLFPKVNAGLTDHGDVYHGDVYSPGNVTLATLALGKYANGPVRVRFDFEARPVNVTGPFGSETQTELGREDVGRFSFQFRSICAGSPTRWHWGANVTVSSVHPRSALTLRERVVFTGQCYPEGSYYDNGIPAPSALVALGVLGLAWRRRPRSMA